MLYVYELNVSAKAKKNELLKYNERKKRLFEFLGKILGSMTYFGPQSVSHVAKSSFISLIQAKTSAEA